MSISAAQERAGHTYLTEKEVVGGAFEIKLTHSVRPQKISAEVWQDETQ